MVDHRKEKESSCKSSRRRGQGVLFVTGRPKYVDIDTVIVVESTREQNREQSSPISGKTMGGADRIQQREQVLCKRVNESSLSSVCV